MPERQPVRFASDTLSRKVAGGAPAPRFSRPAWRQNFGPGAGLQPVCFESNPTLTQ